MAQTKVLKIIELLKSKTVNKQAIWNLRCEEGNINGFEILIDPFLIGIQEIFYGDSEFHRGLEFMICYISNSVEIVKCQFDELENEADFRILKDLWAIIERSFLKVDEILDEVFFELSKDCIIGREVKSYAVVINEQDEDLPF
jgi:hypothetical protein